jgi:hypothetical protein
MSLYLIAYLAIGVCVLLAFLFAGRRANGEWLSLKTELARATPFDPGNWKYWFEVNFLGAILPLVFTVVGVVGWPALIVYKVHDILAQRLRRKRETFTVKRRDLIRQMTAQEIERVEQVVDPMGAVPPVPFGFLNPAWQRFTADLEPTHAIWSFSTQWMNGLRNDTRAGYVLVRGRRIGMYFLASTYAASDR